MDLIFIILYIVLALVGLVCISFFFNFSYTYLFIHNLFVRRLPYVIALCAVIFFIIISYFYYKYKIQPKLDKSYISNKEFTPPNENDEQNKKTATLYLFYTTWCPHCKNAWDSTNKTDKPWNQLTDYLISQKNMINKVEIGVAEIDCEEDTETAEKYKIEGFPTIKLVYDNKIYNYDAKPDKGHLVDFLNQVLK